MEQALTGGGVLVSTKKQREVYVGNLTIGVVTDVMLRELFNGALSHLVPDPVANPPVVNAQLDPSGASHFHKLLDMHWLARCPFGSVLQLTAIGVG
jgi:splicing factor U2AF 65 kDa subunit